MIKIALIHASRQRPQLAYDCFEEWIGKCSDASQIQYILALDDDDPSIPEYERLFYSEGTDNLLLNITESRNLVTAFNSASKEIYPTVELLLAISDDMGCFENWDVELFKLLEGVDNFKEPKFIGVQDGVREYGVLLVYYITNRAYYDKFNYVLYPEYDGVFADNDMHCVAQLMNCIVHAPHLIFQHKHWSLGMSTKDEISSRNDFTTNPEGWSRNQLIYQERAKRNFDL